MSKTLFLLFAISAAIGASAQTAATVSISTDIMVRVDRPVDFDALPLPGQIADSIPLTKYSKEGATQSAVFYFNKASIGESGEYRLVVFVQDGIVSRTELTTIHPDKTIFIKDFAFDNFGVPVRTMTDTQTQSERFFWKSKSDAFEMHAELTIQSGLGRLSLISK